MIHCIFCKIIAKDIASKKIFESVSVLCIEDIHPKAPIHYLIIPKKHYNAIAGITQEDKFLPYHIFEAAQKLAHINSHHSDYRLIINNGEKAGQSIFHLHVHFLSGLDIPIF